MITVPEQCWVASMGNVSGGTQSSGSPKHVLPSTEEHETMRDVRSEPYMAKSADSSPLDPETELTIGVNGGGLPLTAPLFVSSGHLSDHT